MDSYPLTWMPEALRQAGLRVQAVKGWRNRGRPYSFDPRGVVFHHTASPKDSGPAPSLAICVHGRPDLPGPLCNLMIGRDGTVYLVAAGRANHAGLGGPWRNVPKDSGNSYLLGVEVENSGVGEPWSKELLDACDMVFATLLARLRRTPSWLIGHKEWAPTRKIDPSPIEMDEVRSRVRKALARMAADKRKDVKAGKEGEQPSPDRSIEPPKPSGPRVHAVEQGDTLWSIARRYGSTVADLKRLNGLSGDLIHPGDELTVDSSA